MNLIRIAIVDYPRALQSSVQGLKEMFVAANRICAEQQLDIIFQIDIYNIEQILALSGKSSLEGEKREDNALQVVILPLGILAPLFS